MAADAIVAVACTVADDIAVLVAVAFAVAVTTAVAVLLLLPHWRPGGGVHASNRHMYRGKAE